MEFLLLVFLVFGVVMARRPRRRYRTSRRTPRPNPGARARTVVHYEKSTLEERPTARQVASSRASTEVLVVDVRELRGSVWVIDGDTIDICGTRIRLAGIDAPELDDPYGKKAKWTLVDLCKGQEIRAVYDGEQSHQRIVATCYLPDGRDLSAEMVKAGVAIDWPKFSRGKYSGLEVAGIRKKLWRCDARQKGLMPPSIPD